MLGRPERLLVTSLCSAASCLFSCDWRGFSDLEANAPVVFLDEARGVSRSGTSVAAGRDGDRVFAYLGGSPGSSGGAAYNIGLNGSPVVSAAQRGFCTKDNPALEDCSVADGAAYFPLNDSGERDICFAYGWGIAPADSEDPGVLVRCVGNMDATLTAPRTARRERTQARAKGSEHEPLWMASDRSKDPMLVVGSANQRLAWYYESRSKSANLLPTPTSAGASFGERTAVVRLSEDTDAARLLAVSAPDAGQVWLYLAQGDARTPVGCLGGAPGFGRALAAGRVDRDGLDDLVIADDEFVTVFSGAALSEFPEAYEEVCALAALPAGAIIASFGCGSRLALSGCTNSQFGASLAVADLDGDGDGEVLVGAPKMTVNGFDDAGAVLAYDAEGDEPHELGDVFYLSSAEQSDQFGASLAPVEQQDRDVFVAGAAHHGKAAVFFCSGFLSEGDREGRCAR
jgi:hypothetical protein